jgi:predicted RNA-binding protein YlxR (DUF448 family)
MMRFVLSRHGELVYDPAQKIEARGYYLCPAEECIRGVTDGSKRFRKLNISVEEKTLDELRKIVKK